MSNLVVNGDFSSPAITNSATVVANLTEWNNSGVNISNTSVPYIAASPIPVEAGFSQFVFFFNRISGVTISQTITFPKEGFYLFSYWTAARNSSAQDLYSTMDVTLGNLVSQSITYSNFQWKNYTNLIRMGGASNQVLTFTTSSGDGTINKSNFLSGISITYVNELCFKEGTLITCLHPDNRSECHVPIEQLVSTPYPVKTLCNGYLPIQAIGRSIMKNPSHNERIKNRLYKLYGMNYPGIYKPLYITGCHGILVDSLTEQDKQRCMEDFEDNVYTTDGKYRLFAYLDERAEPWEQEGDFPIYHLALASRDNLINHGIYANGLLVESCPVWSLLEKTNTMDIVYTMKHE